MNARLTLVAHAPTAATTTATVPDDPPLDDRGRGWAAATTAPRADRVACAPETACRETCALLHLNPVVDDGLRGWDLGTWRGHTLDELAAERPDDVAAWTTDPAAAPHGGEPLTGLLDRVQAWLAVRPSGHTLAVCGPAVVRAAVVVALAAPPAAFWRVDVAPLTLTDLRGGPSRWALRATGAPLRPGAEGE